MSIAGLKKFFTYIGKNNKPIYPVMAVASAEIVFRPLFTMMDKKSPDETKKYTALREGITEIVAVPTYWACGELAAKGADLFKTDPKAAMRAKHNLMTAGVWGAALLVIPGLCSLVVKPFTERIYKNKARKAQKLDITDNTQSVPTVSKQQISSTGRVALQTKLPVYNYKMADFANSRMKVGL